MMVWVGAMLGWCAAGCSQSEVAESPTAAESSVPEEAASQLDSNDQETLLAESNSTVAEPEPSGPESGQSDTGAPANDAPAPAPGKARPAISTTVPLMTPDVFMQAALQGDASALKRGVRQGLDPDAIGQDGRTALQLAAFDGHTDSVRVLLGEKVTVDHRDPSGRTALMYAATGDNLATVKALLQAGANPNLADKAEQFTPLMFAAAEGQKEIVRALLASGARTEPQDVDGDTAADFAQQNGHSEVVELLKK